MIHLIIILALVFTGIIAMYNSIDSLSPISDQIFVWLLVWLLTSFMWIAAIYIPVNTIYKEIYYKQGQVDAMTNNIKYELTTQSDSTKVWIKIID